jgi:hypothetical protein
MTADLLLLAARLVFVVGVISVPLAVVLRACQGCGRDLWRFVRRREL